MTLNFLCTAEICQRMMSEKNHDVGCLKRLGHKIKFFPGLATEVTFQSTPKRSVELNFVHRIFFCISDILLK